MFNSLCRKWGRDCQNGGWLGLRGHWRWDSQCYRKRWDIVCSRGSSVYLEDTVQSNIYRVLVEEGCLIQAQQSVVPVSQGDRVILKGKKCGGISNWRKEAQFKMEFQWQTWKGAHREVELQEKLWLDVNLVNVLQKREGAFSRGLRWPNAPEKRGKNKGFMVRLQSRKESRLILYFQNCFVKGLKSKSRWI